MSKRSRSRAPGIVALVAALLVAGLIGRLTTPTPDPARPQETHVVAREPRATDVSAGVPVGYSRTRDGAVAAMAAYGQALADPRVQLDDPRRRAVAAAVGTERYAHALEDAEAVFAARRRSAVGQALRPGAHAVFLGLPVAYRVLSYSGSRAVIKSWGVAVAASDTGLEPRASWGTTTTTAVWRDGDWKVDDVRSELGPVPAGTGTPSQAPSFITALAGMRTLRHAP
jgi:hypothetical protein